MYLYKTGEDGEEHRVAYSRFSSTYRWTSPSGAMFYKEKLPSETSFRFCFLWRDDVTSETSRIPDDMFQWGYKVLGTGYEITTQTFDASDFTLKE